MTRRLRWLILLLLGLIGVVLMLLRGLTRVTVVIVAGEPDDVADDHVNRSHGYVPAV